jgi:hypothetical protein
MGLMCPRRISKSSLYLMGGLAQAASLSSGRGYLLSLPIVKSSGNPVFKFLFAKFSTRGYTSGLCPTGASNYYPNSFPHAYIGGFAWSCLGSTRPTQMSFSFSTTPIICNYICHPIDDDVSYPPNTISMC